MACSQQIAIQQAGGRPLLYRALVARQNVTCNDPVMSAQFDTGNSQPILCSWSKVRENHTTAMPIPFRKKATLFGNSRKQKPQDNKQKSDKRNGLSMNNSWRVLNKFYTGRLFPPSPSCRGLTLYPFIHPFWQKRYSFHIPSGNFLFSVSPFRSFYPRK